MTYFLFLTIFLLIPILILVGLTRWDAGRGQRRPASLASWPIAPTLLVHTLIALIYTTPWDNYLVATRVWWYDPALVTGLTIGWVPIEEYTFFILQPILTGLWLFFLARRLPNPTAPPGFGLPQLRWLTTAVAGVVWLIMAVILILGWRPGTYLALELTWALPPIMLQLAFGADILWRNRRLVLLALIPPTLYLALADAIAIGAGTWTIDPQQSLGFYLGGVLPIEEFIFFLLTNTLIVFGVTLVLSPESSRRLARFQERLGARRAATKIGS